MANRTRIVCLCEGKKGKSIDEVFINRLLKSLRPNWLRPWSGNNVVRLVPCGGRSEVIKRTPDELNLCLSVGSDTTLMVWADCDHDHADGESLKREFWTEAQQCGIREENFDRVVFIFAKDRLENWIQFLNTGQTNEAEEGPRLKYDREASEAAKKLARMCGENAVVDGMPPSLHWSCRNWRKLVDRMK